MAFADATAVLGPWGPAFIAGGAPYLSLLVLVALGALMLLLNYSRGLVGAYTFML